jgi:amidase
LALASIGIIDGISASESGEYRQLLAAVHDVAEHVLQLPDYTACADIESYPREQIHRPTEDKQDFGHAWAHKFLIRGNPAGRLLQGKTVCLKDNIAVAGVPQFFGTDAIPAWTSDSDATVVTRALDAGANVVGTTICENFCNSTSSFTVCCCEANAGIIANINRVRKEQCTIPMRRAIRLVAALPVAQR